MRRTVVILLVIIGVAAVAGPSVYFYNKYRHAEWLRNNPTEAAAEETKTVIANVGKLTELPVGEDPSVATISDREKLADQPFFAKAQNGDKVLFYPTSKRAIIYRPSTNKIVDMSQVNVTEPGASQSAQLTPSVSPTPQQETTLAIYNGTTTAKLANTLEKAITDRIPKITVVKKDNAAKQTYAQSLVIDLSGSRTTQAKTLAGIVGGAVGTTLPAGETKPDADILIIIGTSYTP